MEESTMRDLHRSPAEASILAIASSVDMPASVGADTLLLFALALRASDPAAAVLRELHAADCAWLDTHPVRDTKALEAAEQRLKLAQKAVLDWIERDASGSAIGGVPAHSKSEYKRRVALGDENVLPPIGGVPGNQQEGGNG
jgi:hypothetical protein